MLMPSHIVALSYTHQTHDSAKPALLSNEVQRAADNANDGFSRVTTWLAFVMHVSSRQN